MSVSICMLALGAEPELNSGGIQAAWKELWPEAPPLSDPEEGENTLSFSAGDAGVILGLMPAPIPWSDLEQVCAGSWMWPQAADQLRDHQTHVIVTAMSEADAVARLKLLTQAAAAVVKACPQAKGVYWCDSQLALSPEMYLDFVKELLPDAPPLYIWINFQVGMNEDGTASGMTTGLAALGHRELETQSATEPLDELRNRFVGIADYLLSNGPVINDGDTVGEDEHEKIKVFYGDSLFGREADVMRLQYGSSNEEDAGCAMTPYGFIHALGTLALTLAFGWWLYSVASNFMVGSFFRHVLLVPTIFVVGVLLLLVTDRILNVFFGLEAFKD